MKASHALFENLGIGLGLRAQHYDDVLQGGSRVAWFEAISENFMDDGGRPISTLLRVRDRYPVALHGVSLSIASTDDLDRDYLRRLKNLIQKVQPTIVSDHCCWAGFGGQNLHDLLPVPYTEEALRHIAERISYVQDFLGRRILLENVSSYVTFSHSEMGEAEFLGEIAKRADCGILLDVNNVYVNSVNHGFDAKQFLETIPVERVGQMHLAGHSERRNEAGELILIDTHDAPVCQKVWQLFENAVERFGAVSTMVEWDADIPNLARLEEEILKADKIQKRSCK